MSFEKLHKELLEAESDLLDLESGYATSSNLKEHLELLRDFILEKSLEVYLASKKENIHWSHCSTATFNKTYKERLNDALDNDSNEIHNEIEFIESEIEHLSILKNNFSRTNYHHDLFIPITKKIGLLENKLQDLSINNKEELLDISDSKIVDKIIFLHKLGVLDYLRKQSSISSSVNLLAEFLSGVTGEKTETLQSYLNPMYSPQTKQGNNPLTKKTALKRVENQLIKLGIV